MSDASRGEAWRVFSLVVVADAAMLTLPIAFHHVATIGFANVWFCTVLLLSVLRLLARMSDDARDLVRPNLLCAATWITFFVGCTAPMVLI